MKKKRKSKGFLLSLLILIILVLGGFYIYQNYVYDVNLQSKNLVSELDDWLNRGNGTSKVYVDQYKKVKIKDSKTDLIYFLLKDGQVGYVLVDEGLFGKSRFDIAKYDDEPIKFVEIKTTKGTKFFAVGKNPGYTIKTIKVTHPTLGNIMTIEDNKVTKEEDSIQKKFYMIELPKPKGLRVISSLTITYYDWNGKVIEEVK